MSKQLFLLFLGFVVSIILISCEKDVSVSQPFDHEVGTAQYHILTEPAGAAIFVDERNTGLFTPDTVKWLTEGTHEFILKREPFLDYPFTATAENNNLYSKEYSFYSDTKNFGSIKFNSSPDSCAIYFNDSLLTQKTPFILTGLLPDKYKVKYKYPEHRSDSTSVFVYAGKQSFISLSLIDTSFWVTYDVANSDLTDDTIKDIVVDEDNTMWIGTWHNGVIKIKDGNKEFFTTETSNLPNNIVNRIKVDPDGNVWVGTNVGLAKISNGIIISYRTISSGIPGNYVTDFDFDSKGNIWIGTDAGLAKFDGSSWQTYTTSNSSIPGNFVTAVLVDQNDIVWIGTNQYNTSKFDGTDTWIEFQADGLLIKDSVADLIVGNDNKVWIGLVTQPKKGKPGGVYVVERDTLWEKTFNLSNKRVNRFYLDKDNTLWIGSRSGVVEVEPSGAFKLFTSNITGLPINDILAIAKDEVGNIWFGTNGRGLVKYKIWKEE